MRSLKVVAAERGGVTQDKLGADNVGDFSGRWCPGGKEQAPGPGPIFRTGVLFLGGYLSLETQPLRNSSG